METLIREATFQHQLLESSRAHRATMTSPSTLSFPLFSFSSSSKVVLDEDGDARPLAPLTLYDFYFQPREAKKYDFAYILVLDDKTNLFVIPSSSFNSICSSCSFY